MEPKGYFMHRRPKNDDGKPEPRGGVTAYVVFIYNDKTKETRVEYSLARCSFLDNFARATGRRIAVGRFAAGKAQGFTLSAMELADAKKSAYEELASACDRELVAAQNHYRFIQIAEKKVKEATRYLRIVTRHRTGAISE